MPAGTGYELVPIVEVPTAVARPAVATRHRVLSPLFSSRNLFIGLERRYGRKRAAIAAGRGAHLHANWSFSPPPTLMAMKLPTIGNHI